MDPHWHWWCHYYADSVIHSICRMQDGWFSLCADGLSHPDSRPASSHLGHAAWPCSLCTATWQRCCEMSLCTCSQRQRVAAGPYQGDGKQMEVLVKGHTTRLANASPQALCLFCIRGEHIHILCRVQVGSRSVKTMKVYVQNNICKILMLAPPQISGSDDPLSLWPALFHHSVSSYSTAF